ncbi:MAG: hypothetical protein WDN08_21900 [Rhizomicrobium sp.]
MEHRRIVARGFRVGAFVLGVPALAGLLAIGTSVVLARPDGGGSGYLDIGTYGIAGLLANGARGVADVFDWLGGIALWLEGVLAAGLAAALVFAVVLFFTGRGIARHGAGANAVGIGLSVLFVLFWATVLLSVERGAAMTVPAAAWRWRGIRFGCWGGGRP